MNTFATVLIVVLIALPCLIGLKKIGGFFTGKGGCGCGNDECGCHDGEEKLGEVSTGCGCGCGGHHDKKEDGEDHVCSCGGKH